jgi:hypothetical protein
MWPIEAKIAVLTREVKRRRQVYPSRINTRRMKPRQAAYEIAVMEAILFDYEGQLKSVEPVEPDQPELDLGERS